MEVADSSCGAERIVDFVNKGAHGSSGVSRVVILCKYC